MTGKKRYVTRTVRGEHREAQVALGRLLGEMDEGQHTVQVGTVAELCERWYSNAAPDPAPDRALPLEQRAAASLHAHLDWLIDNERSYRAIIHGASSGDPDVQAIVERVRADVVRRISRDVSVSKPSPTFKIAMRGWVGFLEAASLDWLSSRTISKDHLVQVLLGSVAATVAVANAVATRERWDR